MADAPRTHYQRARRKAEKDERRAVILAAAAALLHSTGFEGFSMAALGKKAGIAKGTLYLYFETREEVLLALWVEALRDWSRALRASLREGMSDQDFVACFQTSSLADPNFLTLRSRLESVIEHNVSVDRLVEAKRTMRDLLLELSPRIERALDLEDDRGSRLLIALGALLLGAQQSRTGPAVQSLDLPEDVAEFMRVEPGTDLFRDHARMIIAGTRAAGRG